MLKRKKAADAASAAAKKKARKSEARDLSKYINKQRTLILCARGITFKYRHLMQDLLDLLPHSKKDAKFDLKSKLYAINEVAEMKNCNNCIYLETRKSKDLYMWFAKTPAGPSMKFLVENVHTMAEVKLTGNCLKGSRPILNFDKNFDTSPNYKLMKEMFTQVFGSPKGHRKVKPFVDHVMSFFIADDRVWVRNYQVIFESDTNAQPVLVEIGPRFVLNPIRIFDGSFGGATIWANKHFVSPNEIRSRVKKQLAEKYTKRVAAEAKRDAHKEKNVMPADPLGDVFSNPVTIVDTDTEDESDEEEIIANEEAIIMDDSEEEESDEDEEEESDE